MSILKLVPILAVGAVGIAALMSTYEEKIKNKEISRDDIVNEMKQIQNELARLIELNALNDRFEQTGQVEEINLDINGVSVGERIENLTKRIDVLRDLLKTMKKIN